ncbi:MAG: HD domain-containing protein [Phycisphaerales bacterium]
MIETLDRALIAINAAWSACRLYGEDHSTVTAQVNRAAEALATIPDDRCPVRIFSLPNKLVYESSTLPSNKVLRSGLFARLAPPLPDCLEIGRAVTPESVKRLIACLEASTSVELKPDVEIRPFALRHIDRLDTPCAPAACGVVADARFLAHGLRGAWGSLRKTGAINAPALESLAGDLVAAVAGGRSTILPLADLKSHDEYTYIHAINVGVMSSALARAIGLRPDRVHEITCAGLLHDVGKARVTPALLNKRGKLTHEEFAEMSRHPAHGAVILAATIGLPPVAISVAYEHHMMLDGGGYPTPPPGWRVGLASQLVHIADVFDALRTDRPYRAALPVEQAVEVLQEQSGVAFDAQLLDVFVQEVVARDATSRAASSPSGLIRPETQLIHAAACEAFTPRCQLRLAFAFVLALTYFH